MSKRINECLRMKSKEVCGATHLVLKSRHEGACDDISGGDGVKKNVAAATCSYNGAPPGNRRKISEVSKAAHCGLLSASKTQGLRYGLVN